MRKQTFEIRTPIVQQNAIRTIQQLYPDPERPLIVTIQGKTRSVEQNKRLWATLRDVSE
ncbi:recombination protein NinB, partial [Cronobacter sakazakii]